MRSGILLRTAIASALLAIVVGGAFGVLIGAIDDQRAAGRQVALSREENAAADGLEKLVIDLETGLRGFVITREPRFLEPWRAARAGWRAQATRLASLAHDPGQARRVQRITRAIESYIRAYAEPLVNAVRRDEGAARSLATTMEGKRRVDALRAEFSGFRTAERARLADQQRSADRSAARAARTAGICLAASVVLILLFGGYLIRVVAVPLRRVDAMAGRLAEGNLNVRVPETGIGEVGTLERAFNRMACSLEASRDELRRLADAHAALRRTATLVARAAPPNEVFTAVAEELARLLDADTALIARLDREGMMTVVAWSGAVGLEMPAPGRWTFEQPQIMTAVAHTGDTVRVDDNEDSGALGNAFAGLDISSSLAAPILVAGRIWGAAIVATEGEPLAADAEQRLLDFADLVATAIANADGRAELVASRARLLTAGDDARRRVVRDLHDGAQQRLVQTIVALKLARQDGEESTEALIAEALDQAEQANEELRELAHGMLPPALTRGGLRAGVDALVSRLRVPVDVAVPGQRLPSEIEASAYFVVAEALTNVVKHSRAERAEIRAWLEGGALHLDVRDDGVGGARPDGNGLLGLHDRLAALGGRLDVESPPDGGTRIAATLPL